MVAKFIYHICTKNSWDEQLDSSVYTHNSLESEKFIHCSKEDQIQGVLNRYFQGANDLLLITIEASIIIPTIKYEKGPNGDIFPHVFGKINKDAVQKVTKINAH